MRKIRNVKILAIIGILEILFGSILISSANSAEIVTGEETILNEEDELSQKYSSLTEDDIFVPGELIIKFRDKASVQLSTSNDGFLKTDIDSIDNLNRKYNVKSAEKLLEDSPFASEKDLYKVTIDDEADVLSAMDAYQKDSNIEYAEPNYVLRYATAYGQTGGGSINSDHTQLGLIPNDPELDNQYALDKIKAFQGWENINGFGSKDIVIAIVDSGIDYNHPDLFDNIWVNPDIVKDTDSDGDIDIHDLDLNKDRKISNYERNYYGLSADVMGWDFWLINSNDPMDYFCHGTMVAGIAGAVTNNGIGISGVAGNCKIMNVKAGGVGLFYWDAVQAVEYAANHNPDIISMSFGSKDTFFWPEDGEGGIAMRDAINNAYSKGIVIVACAGNQKTDDRCYPAAFDNVIGVAGTDENDQRWSDPIMGSNYNSEDDKWIDVAAPAAKIFTTFPGGVYTDFLSGTSFAAPHVAGLAALLLSKNPSLTNIEVRNLINEGADQINTDKDIGAGRINVYKSLSLIQDPPIIPVNLPSGSTSMDGSSTSNTQIPSESIGMTSLPSLR